MSPSSPPERRRRAMTLVEVLIAAGLLGIVLFATYQSLLLSLRYQQKNEDSVTTLQQALAAVGKLRQRMAAGASTSLIYDGYGCAFVSADVYSGPFQYDSNGGLLWQKWVCFYTEPDGPQIQEPDGSYYQPNALRLKEQTFPPTSDLPAPPPQDQQVLNMIADPTLTRLTVAHNVAQFVVSGTNAADVLLRIKSTATNDNSVTLQVRLDFRQ